MTSPSEVLKYSVADLRATDRPAEKRRAVFPASPGQERLWFIEQLAPGTTAYNLPEAWRLKGRLDLAAFRDALNELVRRHEPLRTTVGEVDGHPVQQVAETEQVSLEILDLRAHAQPEAEMKRIIDLYARRPFDLARGPLFRVVALLVAEQDTAVLFNLHHIVGDEWSLGVLLRELSTCYSARLHGTGAELPSLPIQYADFAVWQRAQANAPEMQKGVAYWLDRLRGDVRGLCLPADFPRHSAQRYQGATLFHHLNGAPTEKVRAYGKAQGATAFVVLLAAFQALLHRRTLEEDVVIGTILAGREMPETETLMGFFVNTHVLRTNVTGELTFAEVVDRARDTVLGALVHQSVPLDLLLGRLQGARAPGRHALFQILFGFQPGASEHWDLPGIEASRIEVDNGGSKFDLSLLVTESSGELRIRCEYNTDLFRESSVRSLLHQYEALLDSGLSQPECRVSELTLLNQAEQREALATSFGPRLEYSRDLCLHQLFEAQCRRTPQAIAVTSGSESVSYAQLNARAERLACRLASLGVGPEQAIGIFLNRSIDLIVGLLGVLKAGGAYVPIDPLYPRERLRFMLEDSGAQYVITQPDLVHLLPEGTAQREFLMEAAVLIMATSGCRAGRDVSPKRSHPMEVDASGGDVSAKRPYLPGMKGADVPLCEPGLRPGAEPVTPRNLAYLIYTSGSTGRPKGVALEHRNAVALVCWAGATYSADELSGVLASTSVCFDLSVFEIFVPLSWGGRVIMAENALRLADLPARDEVTLINTVPSAMRELTRLQCIPKSVRVINLAGEPLDTALVDDIYGTTCVRRVIDLYGPTETTTYSTFVTRAVAEPPTIGRPISNERVYVLDRSLKLVPPGVIGEICIAGDGVAREYLHLPEFTTAKFLPDPFVPAERLYRTGDLGRWRSDGQLEFLGRADGQVKLRGFRMELGEIESALRAESGVLDAVVIVREDRPGDQRLVGYVVLEQAETRIIALEELRTRLAARLPAFMVPGVLVVLGQLPRTPGGKLDRRALPRPEHAPDPGMAAPVPPRNDAEAIIVEIWREILGRNSFGVHDNFFQLGGHSLLATQVVSRLRRRLQVELPLPAVFESPTPELLAQAVERARRVRSENSSAIKHQLSPSEAQGLLARLEVLSENQVEELLRDMDFNELAK